MRDATYSLCANGFLPPEQMGSPSLQRSIARPPKTELVSGLLNFVDGLPNTATAAMLDCRLAGSGAAEPMSPILLPSGGIPAVMSMTAGPGEDPAGPGV